MTDAIRKPVKPAREKHHFRGVFKVACDVLNRGPIPRRRAKEVEDSMRDRVLNTPYERLPRQRAKEVEEPTGGLLWHMRGSTAVGVRHRFSRRMETRLGLQDLQPRDVVELREHLAFSLWYFGESPVQGKLFFERALPAATSRWTLTQGVKIGKEMRKEFGPALQTFIGIFMEMAEEFGLEYAWRFIRSMGAAPKTERTLEDAYLCLLAFWMLQGGGYSKQRLAPCLACTRFFVTTRPNRETCSDACRQKFYRGSQDDAGKALLKKQAAEYQRKHRAKLRTSSESAPSQLETRTRKADRTSKIPHPSRPRGHNRRPSSTG